MAYVDGFVLSVPKKNIQAYTEMAEKAAKIWMEHGALQYKECVAEDTEDKGFCMTFPQLVNPKEGETIIFAYIVYKSREHRDEVNGKVMKDPRMQDACPSPEQMPFDCKRMAYSGFSAIVEY